VKLVTTSGAPLNHETTLGPVNALIFQNHASFTRNQAIDPRNIARRNKRKRRLILGLETSIDSKTLSPLVLIRTLTLPTSSS
jgi:hypothetical protein